MNTQNPENVPEKKKLGNEISKRRQNRIAAMQFLYAWSATETHGELADELYEFFTKSENNSAGTTDEEKENFAFADTDQLGNDRKFYAFAEFLITGTLKNLKQIDETISDAAQNWDFFRIARCDLAILRLAIFELFFCENIPPVVSINEAIDLAKDFSTNDSHKFVNGILDAVKKHLTRPLRSPKK